MMFHLQPLLHLKRFNCPGQLFRLHNAGEAREAGEAGAKNEVFSPASLAFPAPHRFLYRLIRLSVFAFLLHPSLCSANFIDVASQVGLSQQPSEFRDTSTLGNGAAFSDYDNDGYLDLYLANGEHSALYKNNGNGTFSNVIADSGIKGNIGAAIFGDYDNDGDLDLYLTRLDGKNSLYENQGHGKFEDVTRLAGLEFFGFGSAAVFGDYDADGYIDLYVGSYDFDLSTPNALYKNNGDGTFTDIAQMAGVEERYGLTLGAGFADFDNDYDLDLYVANDFGADHLYLNDGKGRFVEVSAKALGKTPKNSMGVAIGDYDNDGDFDIYITNVGDNFLYKNNGDGTFVEVAKLAGVNDWDGVGWGTAFFDYDNDGDLDLFVVNGNAPGGGAFNSGPDRLFKNNGDGTFSDVTKNFNLDDMREGRGAAFADYDNDGDLDFFVVNLSGGNALYRNENSDSADSNNWLKVKLSGTTSNQNGIGAIISLLANGKRQVRYVSGGESYFSFNELSAHFGLAKNQKAELIEVRWPSGRKSILKDVTTNQAILVTEGKDGYLQLHTAKEAKGTKEVVGVESKWKQLVTLGELKRSALLQNYPNPFNPETWIPYTLESDSEVTVEIFNIEGELVRSLKLGKKRKGAYLKKSEAAYWDGKNNQGEAVGSGVYFYSIYAGDFVETRKMILAR